MSKKKSFIVSAVGNPTTLYGCPIGLFLKKGSLGFKTEYTGNSGPEAYCVDSGEYFWGGTSTVAERLKVRVQPCRIRRSA